MFQLLEEFDLLEAEFIALLRAIGHVPHIDHSLWTDRAFQALDRANVVEQRRRVAELTALLNQEVPPCRAS